MNILVTGANGFIGSNLVKKLVEAKHVVKAMVLKGTNEIFLKDLNCEIVYGDVTKPESFKNFFNNVDIVYHLAALPSNAWTNKILKVNFKGTKNVYSESLKNKVKRFVYMSSLVVHGFKNFEKADENTPLIKARWYKRPYIKSKIKSELFLQTKMNEMEIVIIRPGFMPFGPNDMLASKQILERLDKGKTIPNINHGIAKMCYTYVENLCDGLILAGTNQNAPGQTYLIADDNPPYITMKEFINKLCDEFNLEYPKVNLPYFLVAPFVAILDLFYRIFLRKKLPIISMYTLKVAKYNLYFKSDKAKNDLGYQSKIHLDEAIKKTFLWYKKIYKNLLI
ncbi:MAG: NAD-dependent epimerase/dehydratase family protein [Promethearchaeota archaeon]